MEEFQHLLGADLVELMKNSMYNATVGDGYRVGGVDMDNRMLPFLMKVDLNAQVLIQVYPVYSNPWYGSFHDLEANTQQMQVHARYGGNVCWKPDGR